LKGIITDNGKLRNWLTSWRLKQKHQETSNSMDNRFFEQPILNSPYEYPSRYWELDASGQPTQKIIENRRRAEFITPIPKPRKRKGASTQEQMVFDEGKGLSSQKQQYDPTSIINALRSHVDRWRSIQNPSFWQVTPETVRLLQHWRYHQFTGIRPFFCQIEAVETAIWLNEVMKVFRV
jgi:type III restriction enzyme